MTTSLPHRTIEGHTLFSEDLKENRLVKVYLPPQYDNTKKYPILYCHDGNEFFTHGRIATIATQMMEKEWIAPMLIAGIAVSPQYRTQDYSLHGERNEKYVQFVGEQCIPFVESTYSIDTDARYMAGISLGAVVTLLLHAHYPTYFSRLLLFSTALRPSVLSWLKDTSLSVDAKVYMLIGTNEDQAQTPIGVFDFLHPNEEGRYILRDKGIETTYVESPGSHIWGFWQKHLPHGLLWLQS